MAESLLKNPNPMVGIIEIQGVQLALITLDALQKASEIRVVEVQLNENIGATLKIVGNPPAVRAAIEEAETLVAQFATPGKRAIVTRIADEPPAGAWKTVVVPFAAGNEARPIAANM